jgi:hypothetical protein
MLKLATLTAVAVLSAASAQAMTPAQILAANKTASGGAAWDRKVTLKLDYSYSGQGLTGTNTSLEDLRRGAFVDSYAIGPTSGASGYDGSSAWEKDPSGTVTKQAGGDVLQLAVNEAYRDRNSWWRPGFGGAAIVSAGQKMEGGATFDVLTITPKNGKSFDAWFDANSHLLSRTVEVQSTQTITTFYSDYSPTGGAMIAHKQVIDDGSGEANRQTITLTSARFSAVLPVAAFAQPLEHLSDFTLANGATETTVPFQLLNNHIYANVSVNGGKPMPFIFDTGGHDILTPDTAKLLNVASQGSQDMAGGGEGTAQSGVATVKTITVGAATLTNQPVSVAQFSPPGVEGIREGGMIGYEFFARFVTRFDYGDHTITFIDKKHFDPKDAGIAVPIRFYHQFPEVLGSYDGIPARFGIDTGSRMPLMLTGPFAAKYDIRAKATGGAVAMTGWGVGGPSRGFVFHGGALKLGDVAIDNPLVVLSTDKGGAGAAEAFPNNIGGGVLKRFAVTFDFDHNVMYLKPVAGPVADLDTFDRSGMWINEATDGFKVVEITKDSPAEEAGLKKDDVLVAVDGKPAGSIGLVDLRRRLRNDSPGTVVTFTIKDGAATRDVKVTLRDLI